MDRLQRLMGRGMGMGMGGDGAPPGAVSRFTVTLLRLRIIFLDDISPWERKC